MVKNTNGNLKFKLRLGDYGYDDSEAVVKPGNTSLTENESSENMDGSEHGFQKSTWNSEAKPGKSCLVNYRNKQNSRRNSRRKTQAIGLKFDELDQRKHDFYEKFKISVSCQTEIKRDRENPNYFLIERSNFSFL